MHERSTTGDAGSDPEQDLAARDHAIERALVSLPGVQAALVVRAGVGETARLRLRLRPGHDRAPVARTVAATLAERFDITVDPAAIRLVSDADPGRPVADPRPGVPSSPVVARRASITRVEVVHTDGHVHITITLSRDAQHVAGTVRSTAGAERVLEAVAEATAAALRQLTLRPVGLEVLQVLPEPLEDPKRMLVAVRLQAGRGDEELLGASSVRGDPEEAVVRATLNAVNRRVEPLLYEEPIVGADPDSASAGPTD